MEVAVLVTKPAFSSAEFAEVARGPWTSIIVEFEDDSPCRSGVDGDFKLHARGCELKKANVCGVKTYEDVTREGEGERSLVVEKLRVKGTYRLDIVGRGGEMVRERKHSRRIYIRGRDPGSSLVCLRPSISPDGSGRTEIACQSQAHHRKCRQVNSCLPGVKPRSHPNVKPVRRPSDEFF